MAYIRETPSSQKSQNKVSKMSSGASKIFGNDDGGSRRTNVGSAPDSPSYNPYSYGEGASTYTSSEAKGKTSRTRILEHSDGESVTEEEVNGKGGLVSSRGEGGVGTMFEKGKRTLRRRALMSQPSSDE